MERISYYNKDIKFNRNALKEVYMILSNYENAFDIIPKKYLYVIEDNMNREYAFNLEDIENINLLEDTKRILTYLYTNYISTPEERKILKNLEYIQYNKKIQKYSIQFEQKRLKESNKIIAEEQTTEMIKYKENVFLRLIRFIKQIFRR